MGKKSTHICTRCGVVLDRDHNAALTKALECTQGNILLGGKRFLTDCLYSEPQAGWMKEEPPSIDAGECQIGIWTEGANVGEREARGNGRSHLFCW
jgi:hypothetical protein